ncbi:MAG: electron transport complex subunit RsxC [Porticoccaceae bacterium]|nr:electron transport complex subunit RsxC [Porticoccaceae bacterium]
MNKTWVTPGGVHPPENKLQSVTQGIGQLPIPETLVIPLSQHIGAAAIPCVEVGQSVLKGQVIAKPAGVVSIPMHAPTSGTVSAIEHRPIAHSSGMLAPCIEITSDGADTWIEHEGISDYEHISPTKLVEMVGNAGISGMGGAGFPSAVKLNPGRQRPIDTLIVNATECEPYITADDSAIRERAAEIVEGIKILSAILGHPHHIMIGIEDNKPEAIEALAPHVEGTGISVVVFPTKYPSGGEKQLIYILTSKELPSGKLPADIGMVCINIGTTYAIKRAIIDGEPLVSRVTTVTGDAVGIQRNYDTLIGTPVSHLLAHNEYNEQAGGRVVMGGPMMGFTLPSADVPIVKTTNCILAPSYAEIPDDEPAQPCIRCGMCAEACPASLLPQQLFWYAQAQDHERLEAHNLFDCIECGACSYVCPSNIPLVQYYRAAKGEIRHAQDEKVKADHARERFEFHKERIEQAEREKEEKRAARREAALKAKAAAAEKPADKSDSAPSSSAADIIAAAQARAAAKQVSPEDQQAKLERTIAAAEQRLIVAEQKLAEAIESNSDKQAVLSAAVENTRQKLQQSKTKLAELTA